MDSVREGKVVCMFMKKVFINVMLMGCISFVFISGAFAQNLCEQKKSQGASPLSESNPGFMLIAAQKSPAAAAKPDERPSITLTSVIPEKTEHDTLVIQGIADDDQGIPEVTVMVKKPSSNAFLPIAELQREQEKFNATIALELGKNEIIVEAIDSAGQTAKEVFTVARTVPPTPTPAADMFPFVTVTSPVPAETEQEVLTLQGQATDDKGVTDVSVSVKPPEATTFSPVANLTRDRDAFKADVPLNVGLTTIMIIAKDTAGQVGRRVFTVVRTVPATPTPAPDTPPVLTFAAAFPAETDREALTIAGTATDDQGSADLKITVKQPGVNDLALPLVQREQDQFKAEIPLAAGPNEITIEARDAKGQTTKEVFTVARTVLPTPTPEPDMFPFVTLVSAIPAETEQERLALQGLATDDKGIADVTVSVKNPGSATFLPAENLTRDHETFEADVQLDVGVNTILIAAQDTAGQMGRRVFTVVRTVPATPTPAPDTPPILTFATALPDKTEQEAVSLAGAVTDDQSLADLKITVKQPGTNEPVLASLQREQDRFNAEIPLAVGSNEITVAASDAKKQTVTETFTVIRQAIPTPTPQPDERPVITFTPPILTGTETETETLAIQGIANDEHGVAEVKVTVQSPGAARGIAFPIDDDAGPEKKGYVRKQLPFNKEVPLGIGSNEVTVKATNLLGKEAVQVLTIVRKVMPPPVGPAASAGPPKGKGEVYAVIIAIANYQDPRLNLKYTVKDAQGIYDVLTDPKFGGVPKDHIQLLLDQEATTRNIKNKLGTWLPRQAKEEDTVMIYYSGHGAPEEDRTYWVTYDADVNDLYSSALGNNEIHEMLNAIKSERVVTFLDSCYSAATVVRTNNTRSLPTEIPFENFAGKGRLVISASDGKQFSLELAEYGHGVFTYYLLKGLKGEADGKAGGPPDGVIDVDEIWNYVKYQVTETARKAGNSQTPVFQGAITAGIPLTFNMAFFQEKQRAQTIAENKKKLTEFFRKKVIRTEDFSCAVTMLSAPQLDPLLEGLLSGTIPPEVFNQTFSCNPQ